MMIYKIEYELLPCNNGKLPVLNGYLIYRSILNKILNIDKTLIEVFCSFRTTQPLVVTSLHHKSDEYCNNMNYRNTKHKKHFLNIKENELYCFSTSILQISYLQ